MISNTSNSIRILWMLAFIFFFYLSSAQNDSKLPLSFQFGLAGQASEFHYWSNDKMNYNTVQDSNENFRSEPSIRGNIGINFQIAELWELKLGLDYSRLTFNHLYWSSTLNSYQEGKFYSENRLVYRFGADRIILRNDFLDLALTSFIIYDWHLEEEKFGSYHSIELRFNKVGSNYVIFEPFYEQSFAFGRDVINNSIKKDHFTYGVKFNYKIEI